MGRQQGRKWTPSPPEVLRAGRKASTDQFVCITDLISEGPIFGLVNSVASVAVSETSILRDKFAGRLFSQTSARATYSGSGTTASLTGMTDGNGKNMDFPVTDPNGNLYCIFRGGSIASRACRLHSAGDGLHEITITNALFTEAMISVAGAYDSTFTQTITTINSGTDQEHNQFVITGGSAAALMSSRTRKHIGARITDTFTGEVYEGCLAKRIASTKAVWVSGPGVNRSGGIELEGEPYDYTRYKIEVDWCGRVGNMVSNSANITFAAAPSVTGCIAGTFQFDFTTFDLQDTENNSILSEFNLARIYSPRIQFFTGHCHQPLLRGPSSIGTLGVSNTPNPNTLTQNTLFGRGDYMTGNQDASKGTGNPVIIHSTAANGFNLTPEQVQEADELDIVFSYPQGIYDGRDDAWQFAAYTMELQLKLLGESDFNHRAFIGIPQSSFNGLVLQKTLDFRNHPFSQDLLEASDAGQSNALTFIRTSTGDAYENNDPSTHGRQQFHIAVPGTTSTTNPETDREKFFYHNLKYSNVFINAYVGVNKVLGEAYLKRKIQSFEKEPLIIHEGKTKNALNFTETIDLNDFRPFQDFRLVIRKITENDGREGGSKGYGGNDGLIKTDHAGSSIAPSNISSVTARFNEKVYYPYTAVARVEYSGRQSKQIEPRTYHCKGLKIRVPSNYVTRDEAGSKQAAYTRNVTSGAIESSYQDWDGNLRGDITYCNNPAWIFHDLITNNRYGLGDALKYNSSSALSKVNLAALYRIGRYCDELVTYNGVTEPRFTCNAYLKNASDAKKVLADFASVFRASAYWMDGQITPIMDVPKQAIYTFSKSNVVDGEFTYSSFGQKSKSNQIIVTWNDPNMDFTQQRVMVEDSADIARTGEVITESIVAFGCTSEGQAKRYGRWALFTGINQLETVNFKSSIVVSFLVPGDIIQVHDSDRYNKRLSGRISKTQTITNTSIPLDSNVTIDSGKSYKISILIPKPAAILASDITISGTTTKAGTVIFQGYVNGSLTNIDTEDKSLNAFADAAETTPYHLNWSPYHYVETRDVNAGAGAGSYSAIVPTVAFNFTSSDYDTIREGLWMLEELDPANTKVWNPESTKLYQIGSISESDGSVYSVVATEYFSEKFDFVEDNEIKETLQYDTENIVSISEEVPPPKSVELMILDNGSIQATYVPPDGYDHIQGYRLYASALYEGDVIKGKNDLTHIFPFDIIKAAGQNITVMVKTESVIGSLSAATVQNIIIPDSAAELSERLTPENLLFGGSSNANLFIDQTNSKIKFSKSAWRVIANKPGSTAIENASTDLGSYEQDISGMPNLTVPDTAEGFNTGLHYLLVDADATTDKLKLVKYYVNATGANYWYDTGTGSTTRANALVSKTGTISGDATTNIIIGDGSTDFSTDFTPGSVIVFTDAGGTEQVKQVTKVTDDSLVLASTLEVGISSSTTYKTTNFSPEINKDIIVAKIQNPA